MLPPDEPQRLAALQRYQILDTPPDGAFDHLTAVAAALFTVPIAVVSLVDHDRIWFKSHHGLDLCETGREPVLPCRCSSSRTASCLSTRSSLNARLSARDSGARLTREDLRALTPLFHWHINPYGQFALDLAPFIPGGCVTKEPDARIECFIVFGPATPYWVLSQLPLCSPLKRVGYLL
jgi:hypothetical protein